MAEPSAEAMKAVEMLESSNPDFEDDITNAAARIIDTAFAPLRERIKELENSLDAAWEDSMGEDL